MNSDERVRNAYPPLTEREPPAGTVERLHTLYTEDASDTAPRRTRRARRGWIGIAGVLVLGGTAWAAGGGWTPQLGDADRGPRPRPAMADVPAAQRAALSIMRRPQSDLDRGTLVRRALRLLDRRQIDGVHTDAIRVISHGPRELSVLIPVERLSVPDARHPPDTARDVLCLMSTSYQNARTIQIPQNGRMRQWRIPAGFNSFGQTCGDLQTLRSTGIRTATSPDGSGGLVTDNRPDRITNRYVTLVPDGVSRVRVRLRGGRHIMATVRDNVYRFTTKGIQPGWPTTWLDRAGHVIKHPRP